MWDIINQYTNSHAKVRPNYIDIFGLRIYKNSYEDAFNRVIQFRNANNKQNPKTVNVDGVPLVVPPTVTPTKGKGVVTSYFQKKMDVEINSGDEAYNHLKDKGGTYGYYYDDQRTNKKIIDNLSDPNIKEDSNCTDITQVLHNIYEEFGEHVYYCRAEVRCLDGKWYGHVYLRKASNNQVVDGAGMLAHGYPIGKLICGNGLRNETKDPLWLTQAKDNKGL